MKKVHTKEMVCHLWANQHQDEARTPTGSLYFRRNTIYSYGSHFPIASHVENKKGEKAILFTLRSYSNSTSKHISIVRGSISSYQNLIYCWYPEGTKNDNFNQFAQQILEISRSLPTARKPEKYIEMIQKVNVDIIKYAEFMYVKIPKELEKLMLIADKDSYKEILAKRAKKIEIDRKKKLKAEKEARRLKIEKFHNEDVPDWRNGDISYIESKYITGYDILRYNPIKQEIETSQRVFIPVEIGQRFFHTIKQVLNKTIECPKEFLNFRIYIICEEFIEIGCHKIKMEEILTLAKQLKF